MPHLELIVRRPRTAALAALVLLAPAAALAQFPSRVGSVGFFDVPAAETMGRFNGALALEGFVDQRSGVWKVAPLPLVAIGGIGDAVDVGVVLRDGDLPNDPRPGMPLWGVTLKYAPLRAVGLRPGLAVAATMDRLNFEVESSLSVIASTAPLGPFRASGFVGAQLTALRWDTVGVTAGLALVLRHPVGLEGVVEGLRTSRGWLVGGGLRWTIADHVGLTLSAMWIPGDAAPRLSLGLAVFTGAPSFEAPPPEPEKTAAADKAPGRKPFASDRPKLRLRIHGSPPRTESEGRHVQYPGDEDLDGAEPAAEPAPPPGPPPPSAPVPTPDVPKRVP